MGEDEEVHGTSRRQSISGFSRMQYMLWVQYSVRKGARLSMENTLEMVFVLQLVSK